MNVPRKMAVLLLATAMLGGMAYAHPHGEQWALASEYPATSLPGQGDAHFARLVADRTRGKLSIVPMPDARLGYKAREQLKAVAEGKVAMADTFGAALGEEPLVAKSFVEARTRYDAARPAYDKAFAKYNQKLLYATPWPPRDDTIALSFTTVNLDKWNSLDEATREAVRIAAAETEARQWQAARAAFDDGRR